MCNVELNFTYKLASKVSVGALTYLTRIKSEIVLYLLADLNISGYIPVAIDE